MYDSEFGNSVVVAASSQCPLHPCPFCHLKLRHDSSERDVRHRCRDITLHTRFQIRIMLSQYVCRSSAARNILLGMGSTAKLPVALSAQELVGAETSDDFVEAMEKFVTSAYSGGADGVNATVGSTATGSGSSTTGRKRYMDSDEYPQWQFKSGQKKRKWTAYDRDCTEQLEEAHSQGEHTVHLEIGRWRYVIYLAGFTQLSLNTNTRRDVRRLTGPPAYDS